MVRLQQFSLALGVINNILVCDRENRIIFAGDDIKKDLFASAGGGVPKIQGKTLGSITAPGCGPDLEKQVQLAREQKKSCDFRLKNKNLLIFPANYGESDNIIIAAEDQLILGNNIESALKERIKELKCLYSISNELEIEEDLDVALEKCTAHLADGFQFPDISVASIILDGKLFGDPCCVSVDGCHFDRLSENIVIGGETRGEISVCYKEKAEFLEEELKLMREISLMLSRIIERKETRKNLEIQKELLVSKNDELTRLTTSLTWMNNNLQAFLHAITDSIVVVDREFNITLSNKEEMGSGKCHKKIFHSDAPCDNCPALEAFDTASPVSREKRFNDRYFTLQAYPIRCGNDDTVETVLEICSDVTKDVYMKSQLFQSSKLTSLGKLVAGVAHEINNPNTFIRGNINIIDEAMRDILPILDRAYREDNSLTIARLDYDVFKENIPIMLDDMKGGANRIKKIVDGLRNFAKKDEGLLTDEVNINSLIKNNMRFTEKEIRKRARLEISLDESIPAIKGNIQKLEQVLMNLMLNAGQAIDKARQGLIRITTSRDDGSSDIIVKISDNGKGMSEETQKHIFDPFFTTRRDTGGTGLGLSISYGIIQEHNGNIEVYSRPGKGTTFTLRLPVQQPAG